MSEHTKTWRVKWRSTFTGHTGQGTELRYKHDAERWADYANADPACRGVKHDIEDTQAMTPLHRSVPQRRRRNLAAVLDGLLMFLAFLIPASFGIAMIVMSIVCALSDHPSRLQPALDQIQRDIEHEQRELDQIRRFGERKCWSGEVGR